MSKGVETKVIRPPIQKVVSGKIFKPDRAYLHKLWAKNTAIGGTIWLGTLLATYLFIRGFYALDPSEFGPALTTMEVWMPIMSRWLIYGNLIWLIPALIILPIYVNSIEYSVISESGETMPEIYVKKGIITVTRKHVPFRTITNIASKIGPFDRLFGVGNVSIETAGYSGASQQGPEEKLEGIIFHEEVRDFILRELRKFRTPFTTTTEPDGKLEEPVPRGPGLDDEMLITLREIRDLLKKN